MRSTVHFVLGPTMRVTVIPSGLETTLRTMYQLLGDSMKDLYPERNYRDYEGLDIRDRQQTQQVVEGPVTAHLSPESLDMIRRVIRDEINKVVAELEEA